MCALSRAACRQACNKYNGRMGEFKMPETNRWEAVEAWLKESEPPPQPPSIQAAMGWWGTRGFIAGAAAGCLLLLASATVEAIGGGVRPIDSKFLLAFPFAMGFLAVPFAIAGTLVGLLVGLYRRREFRANR